MQLLTHTLTSAVYLKMLEFMEVMGYYITYDYTNLMTRPHSRH